MKTVHTFCRICASYCGVDVFIADDGKIDRIRPDKLNPYTFRDFCAKGRTANEILDHPRRILAPMKRVGDAYVESTWEEAIADISARLRRVIDGDVPDAMGVYWGNPAGFSSSHPPFLAGFMNAVGTRNRFFVGSVDQNNYHAVAEAMFGSQLMVLVPDIDDCQCFLLVGTNPAVSRFQWMSGVAPNGWARILVAQARGAKLIVVDPVRTTTAEHADLHVAVLPGQDWAFVLAVLKVILEAGWENSTACAEFAEYESLVGLCREADLGDLSARCDVPVPTIIEVARGFSHAETAFCEMATGVSQNLAGTVGQWLGMALNAVTGRLDRPGGRRYERGYVDTAGLFDRLTRPIVGVSRVRGIRPVAGHFPQAIIAEEIQNAGPGQILALIISAGNPVIAGPNGERLDRALSSLDLLVAVDFVQRESHRWAHWLIPFAHWLERDDLLSLTSQAIDAPFVQFGPRAVPPPPQVRQEWEFYTDLAIAMRVPLFGIRGVNTFIRASRWLARVSHRPALAFDAMWITRALVKWGRRIKWKDIRSHPHGWLYAEKRYGDLAAAIRTDDKRVHVAPAEFVAETRRLLAADRRQPPPGYPLLLVSKRHKNSMNSWLNELPSLRKRQGRNDVEIRPDDAAERSIATGDLVRVSSPVGVFDAIALVSDTPRPGVIVSAQGWGSGVYDPAGSQPIMLGANRNRVVDDSALDPLSGIPALNSTYVQVAKSERCDMSIDHSVQ